MKQKLTYKAASVIGLATVIAATAFGQNGPINVNVNGRAINFPDAQPQMMGNYVMVPLRGVFERMGATVDWYASDQTIVAHKGSTRVELKIDDNQAMVNGKTITTAKAPIIYRGSTLVPIRFISETLGAFVDWDATANLVSISTVTTYANSNPSDAPFRTVLQPRGTVLPVRLNDSLNSADNQVGDRFTASIDTNGNTEYFGIPRGTKVEGHVNFAQPKSGDTPGVLGLAYDNMVMPDGTRIPIDATLTGLDEKSVDNRNGRLRAKTMANSKDDMKYVGTGAGAGVLLALVTHKNVVTDGVLGGALGYLYQTLIGNKQDIKNVSLDRGTPLGVRLDSQLELRVPGSN